MVMDLAMTWIKLKNSHCQMQQQLHQHLPHRQCRAGPKALMQPCECNDDAISKTRRSRQSAHVNSPPT